MLDMALTARDLGHSSLVVTDHNWVHDGNFHTGLREKKVLEENGLAPVPIIVGAEIMTPFGEFLLFGTKPLKNWEQYKGPMEHAVKGFGESCWVELFKQYVLFKNTFTFWQGITKVTKATLLDYALVMCHPRFDASYVEAVPEQWWELVHGFEVVNGLEDFRETRPGTVEALRAAMPGAMELKNSDAHSTRELGQCQNETPMEITDEGRLLGWLRSGRKTWRKGVSDFLDGETEDVPDKYNEVFVNNLEDILA
jgi:hypothetical protein